MHYLFVFIVATSCRFARHCDLLAAINGPWSESFRFLGLNGMVMTLVHPYDSRMFIEIPVKGEVTPKNGLNMFESSLECHLCQYFEWTQCDI